MYFLVYVSSAVKPFSADELLNILAKSRENNARQGISGMLLYKDGNVMQVLEGEREVVLDLHERISHDPRHRGLLTLLQGPLAARQFPDWTMGFRDLNSAESHATTGFSEFMNTSLTGEEFSADPTRAQRMLLTFKRAM